MGLIDSVLVAVVHIGKVGMGVASRRMRMRMAMRFLAVPVKIVPMPVMLIMCMAVGMLQWLMRVPMRVVFGQVQPDAQAHE